jgi:hypothetical protein
MSARKVCRGTRPSLAHSVRAISAPPRRPPRLDLDPLGAKLLGHAQGLLDGPTKATRRSSCCAMDSRNQLCICFRAADFVNLNHKLTTKLAFEFVPKLFNFNALSSDNNTGACSEKNQSNLVGSSLDFDLGNTGVKSFSFTYFRSFLSSKTYSAYFLSLNQRDFQFLLYPKRNP